MSDGISDKFQIVEINKEIIDLKKELNISEIKQLLVTLPQKAYTKACDRMNTYEAINIHKKLLQSREDKILLEISKDENLKNQSQRDAKLRIELENDDTYKNVRNTLESLEKDKNLYESQYNYYLNEWSSMKKLYNEYLIMLQADKKIIDGDSNE